MRVLLLSALVCAVSAAPSRPIIVPDYTPEHHAPVAVHSAPVAVHAAPVAVVSSQSHAQDELGQYSYSYSNPHSSKVETKTLDGVTRGGYAYVDSHGLVQNVNYVSDDVNGFRVAASNLPLGPVEPQKDEPHVAHEKAKAVAALHHAAVKDSALIHENDVAPVYVESHEEAPAYVPHPAPVPTPTYVKVHSAPAPPAYVEVHSTPAPPTYVEKHVTLEHEPAYVQVHSTPAPHAYVEKDVVLEHGPAYVPVHSTPAPVTYVEKHEAPAYVPVHSTPAPVTYVEKHEAPAYVAVHPTPAPVTYVEKHEAPAYVPVHSTPAPVTYVEKHVELEHAPAYVKYHSTPAPEVYVTPVPSYASPSPTPLVSHAPSPTPLDSHALSPLYHRSAPIAHVTPAPEVHLVPNHHEAPTFLPEHATPTAYSHPEHAHSYATVELDLSDVPAPHHSPAEYFRPAPAAIAHAPLPVAVSSTPAPVVYEEPAKLVVPSPTPVYQEVPTPVVHEVPTPVVHEVPTPVVHAAAPVAVHPAPVAVHAAPVAVVSSQSHAQDELGQYSYSYSNPLSSKVETKTLDGVTRGGYAYVDSHGLVQNVNYVSDDHHGFRVAASNLPSQVAPVDIPDSHDVAEAKKVFFSEIAKAKAAVGYAHH